MVNYPYYMRFFSTSDRLEIAGIPWAIPEKNPSRQEALVYYRSVAEHFDLNVRQYETVVAQAEEIRRGYQNLQEARTREAEFNRLHSALMELRLREQEAQK